MPHACHGVSCFFRADLEHMQYLTNKSCLFLSDAFGLEVIYETLGFADLMENDVSRGRKKGYGVFAMANATTLGQRVSTGNIDGQRIIDIGFAGRTLSPILHNARV
jgi:hypothetical protein